MARLIIGEDGAYCRLSTSPRSVGDLLFLIGEVAREQEQIEFKTLIQAVGARSYGPFLLLIGLILASPLSGVPGLATLVGITLLISSFQVLLGRGDIWLPGWLLGRTISSEHVVRSMRWVERPAQMVDWWLRPRLTVLVTNGGAVLIALVCMVLALVMPLMEFVPFSVTAIGLALILFGLGLVAADGLLVLLGVTYLTSLSTLTLTGLL